MFHCHQNVHASPHFKLIDQGWSAPRALGKWYPVSAVDRRVTVLSSTTYFCGFHGASSSVVDAQFAPFPPSRPPSPPPAPRPPPPSPPPPPPPMQCNGYVEPANSLSYARRLPNIRHVCVSLVIIRENRGWLSAGPVLGDHPKGNFGPLGLHGKTDMIPTTSTDLQIDVRTSRSVTKYYPGRVSKPAVFSRLPFRFKTPTRVSVFVWLSVLPVVPCSHDWCSHGEIG
eukprot:1176036-Prorocentrum_minimum.AAC.3